MEILATEEEIYPLRAAGTHNGTCITSRFTFDNGKTAMFLADNTPAINEQLALMYGSYLKSDVLQVAHHGLTGAEITSYQFINPDVCFWPTTETRFKGYYDKHGDGPLNDDQWCIGYAFRMQNGKPVPKLICEANAWLREIAEIKILDNGTYEVVLKADAYRKHYSNEQTITVNMYHLEADPVIFNGQ
jgi:hypothetical protein